MQMHSAWQPRSRRKTRGKPSSPEADWSAVAAAATPVRRATGTGQNTPWRRRRDRQDGEPGFNDDPLSPYRKEGR